MKLKNNKTNINQTEDFLNSNKDIFSKKNS